MSIRSLLVRILLILVGIYSVATFVVMSINQNYFNAQSEYRAASDQLILLSRDTEETLQKITLDVSTLDSQIELLATRSLPLDCCQAEYDRYLSAIADGSAEAWSSAALYRLSESAEQFLRVAQQTLSEESEELDRLQEVRSLVVPSTAIVLLLLSLVLVFVLINRHLVAPMARLDDFVRAAFRGADPKATDLTSAVSELKFLKRSFESFLADYRGNLRSRDQRAAEMSDASDSLERQFQKLIEISENPALILDAGGAIRTWNKYMVALTGISKSQANRRTFSEELLVGSSAEIFNEAFQIARGGGIPDEFRCELTLAGGRKISLQLQLSPQIESTLGVNRVLVVVNSSDDSVPLSQSIDDSLQKVGIDLVSELSSSLHWLQPLEHARTDSEALRQKAALEAAIDWIGSRKYAREQSNLNLSELVVHFVSTFSPKLMDLDFEVSLEVVSGNEPISVRGNAGSILAVLEHLGENALQAIREQTPKKGQILLSLSSTDGSVGRVTMADNGVGIPQGFAAQMFAPFFTTKATRGHYGLGLTQSRDLVHDMNGKLFVGGGSEGQGLEMIIELPKVTL